MDIFDMATRPFGFLNLFLMMCLIFFWGSSFVVVKIALREGLTPISIATSRFLVAGTLFAVVLLLKKRHNSDYRLVEKKDAHVLVFLAFSGVTFFFTAQYTGIQLANASIAAIVVCLLSPILISIVSTKMLNERLSRKQILGITIAATGTLMVIVGGISPNNSDTFLTGSLILLSTPVLWTFYSVYGKKIMRKYDPFLVATYVTGLGGVFLIPFSIAEGSLGSVFKMNLNSYITILYLSLTCSLIGYYIWLHMIHKVGAAVTSTFLFAEPLVTALLAVTLVEEEITLSLLFGGILIFVGVYSVTKNNSR